MKRLALMMGLFLMCLMVSNVQATCMDKTVDEQSLSASGGQCSSVFATRSDIPYNYVYVNYDPISGMTSICGLPETGLTGFTAIVDNVLYASSLPNSYRSTSLAEFRWDGSTKTFSVVAGMMRSNIAITHDPYNTFVGECPHFKVQRGNGTYKMYLDVQTGTSSNLFTFDVIH